LISFPRWVRYALVILLVTDILVFSRATTLTIMGMVIGTAVVLLGLAYSYRVAAFVGMLVVATVAGASVEIPTLTELSSLLTAMLGLLLPIFALAWLALTAEEKQGREVTLMRRPLGIAIAFAILALWSAPLTILVMSLFAPNIALRLTVVTEAAIMLIAAIIGIVILTRKDPTVRMAAGEEPAE